VQRCARDTPFLNVQSLHASAEAERHDGRQDALGGSRAVPRRAARAVERAGVGGAPVTERARKVHVDYVARAHALDHEHSRQADGTPYPGVREQVQRH
jgi:hypothetical protein